MTPQNPPWPITGGALDEINTTFHDAYGGLRDAVATRDPVFVFLDHALTIVWQGQQQRIAVSPQRYHELKSIAHAPVAAFALLRGARDQVLTPEQRSALERLSANVRDNMVARDLEPARITLDATAAFLDAVLTNGRVTAHSLEAFARKLGPTLLAVTDAATEVELAALHEAVEGALALLPQDRHAALQVVVVGEHQARERSLPMQYFRKRLREAAGAEDRVAYAEGVQSVQEALQLVGTRRLDRIVAVAFFGDAKRLQRDVLGDAAKARLDAMELPPI